MDVLFWFSLIVGFWGHFILVVASHNWFYGYPFSQRVGDFFQFFHYVVGFLGIWFVWAGAVNLTAFVGKYPGVGLAGSAMYLLIAIASALIIFPLSEIYNRSFWKKISPKHLNLTRMSFRDQQADGWFFPERIPYNQCFDLEIRELGLKWLVSQKIDFNLRILHISDLHMGGLKDRRYFELVMEKASRLMPDLVVVTGDIVDKAKCAGWIGPVLGKIKARFGKVAVLGNHDLWNDPDMVGKCLARAGFKILHDQWHCFDFHGIPVGILGIGYPWFSDALPVVPEKNECKFQMLLSHSPDPVYWASKNRFDLMLSGHVHGGQIVCPGIGPILVPSKYGRRFAGGIYQVGRTVLNVSKGVGGSLPLRLFCSPEITFLNCSFEA